jgi:hypothetical protein
MSDLVNNRLLNSIINSKPILITKEDLLNFGDNINLVSVDPNSNLVADTEKPFSIRMLNWIEPYKVKDSIKTLFYTEVNSNLKVGDRIFIINGNYDSDILIKDNKYRKGRDGYKVLFVDRCKIALDIDYSEAFPYEDDFIDEYIKVYYIKDTNDFEYYNNEITAKTGNVSNINNIYKYKFSSAYPKEFESANTPSPQYMGEYALHNTVAFIEEGLHPDIQERGFYLKNTINNQNNWVKIDLFNNLQVKDFFDLKYLEFDFSPIGSQNNLYIYIGNFRIKVMNDTFNFKNVEFKEGYVYKYGENKWDLDIKHIVPILCKSNFRDGKFKGKWNHGLYGRYDKKLSWNGDGIWNNGTTFNTIWKNGNINSDVILTNSFFSSFDEKGFPFQKFDSPNNKGYGYNYFIDSEFNVKDGGEIVVFNGNIIGAKLIGEDISLMEKYYDGGVGQTNSLIIRKGSFENSLIHNTYLFNSLLSNSRINNCHIEDSKSINSQLKNSIFKNSNINGEDIIKIRNYDDFEIENHPNNNNYRVFRFYIDEKSFYRLKKDDYFYIRGIVYNDDDNNLLKFFDRKFKIDIISDFNDIVETQSSQILKEEIKITTILNSPRDNRVKDGYSLDILFQGSHKSLKDVIDFKNAFIIDSEFNSGLFTNSNWNSGSYINFNKEVNITNDNNIGGIYNITLNDDSKLEVTISNFSNSEIKDDYLKDSSIVYLSCVDSLDQNLRLPDTYKIESSEKNSNGLVLTLVPLLSTLSPYGGSFSTIDGYNRYGYLHRVKIEKSKLISGIFKRAYICNSLIDNSDIDSSLIKDFSDNNLVKTLLLSDVLFSNTGNIIKSGIVINSSIVGNVNDNLDKWLNGVAYNVIWNGLDFQGGFIKDSTWINGNFKNGEFLNSKTFNSSIGNYKDDNIYSYYKSGDIGLGFNDRHSWQDGVFENGIFNNSDWENGFFIDGNFRFSYWYNGTFSGGVIGDRKLDISETFFYNGTILNGFVDNATLFATGSNIGITNPEILWENGFFNLGIFGSSDENSAIWYNGEFNGGEFISFAKWKNGKFNGGKFISELGSNLQDENNPHSYTWENGIFNGGEFGNADFEENSTWYTGEFNGGIFQGKVWNNGIFMYGEFLGSSAFSAVGGLKNENANNFIKSFTQSYFGLWKNGIVTDIKDKFIKDKQTITDLENIEKNTNTERSAIFKNVLWESGTFSHPAGEMNNCVWLDGTFDNGLFKKSSFNPYIFINETQGNFNIEDTCIWKNGTLTDSEFSISKWEDGLFIFGTAVGMIWENGISNYMNAYNIYWENGIWKNGNWYGSNFEIEDGGKIEDDYVKKVLNRIMNHNLVGTSSCHVWNIFDKKELKSKSILTANASAPNTNQEQLSARLDVGLQQQTNNEIQPPSPFIYFSRTEIDEDGDLDNENVGGEELKISALGRNSVLNNTNINLTDSRYSIVEFDILTHSTATTMIDENKYSLPILNFSNLNYEDIGVDVKTTIDGLTINRLTKRTPMSYLPIWEPINHLLTKNTKKYEYFFGKKNLSMNITGSGDLAQTKSEMILNNIKVYEVDMIPFFKYFNDENIYKGIQLPFQGNAPFIEYESSDFSFINNIELNFDITNILK